MPANLQYKFTLQAIVRMDRQDSINLKQRLQERKITILILSTEYDDSLHKPKI